VDLMDLTVNLGAWKRISDPMKDLVEEQVRIYSDLHYLGIQKRNIEALAKFKEAGSTVNRMSQEDMQAFRRNAVPIWYNWARKSPGAAKVFKLQLDFMMNDLMGYVTKEDIKGQSL
jgi:TRAP-type C4-dicarboxylate transport system substrate-binding protein